MRDTCPLQTKHVRRAEVLKSIVDSIRPKNVNYTLSNINDSMVNHFTWLIPIFSHFFLQYVHIDFSR